MPTLCTITAPPALTFDALVDGKEFHARE